MRIMNKITPKSNFSAKKQTIKQTNRSQVSYNVLKIPNFIEKLTRAAKRRLGRKDVSKTKLRSTSKELEFIFQQSIFFMIKQCLSH